jgi:hypothetical protein
MAHNAGGTGGTSGSDPDPADPNPNGGTSNNGDPDDDFATGIDLDEMDEMLISDCRVLNQLSQSPDFIAKMNELKTATLGDIEISYLGVTDGNGTTTFPSFYRDQGQPNSHEVPLVIPTGPINVMLHNHSTESTPNVTSNRSLPVQSPSDLNAIYNFYENGHITNLDNFVSVLITPDQTVYALTINWPSDFQTNGEKFLKIIDVIERKYSNVILEGNANDINETNFAKTLKKLNVGITLYRGNFNTIRDMAPFTKWTKIKIDNNGIKTTSDCN